MERLVLALFVEALRTAAVLALPIVTVVALIGVLVGVAQTLVQVQDQNVAFAPKLAAVAALAAAAGPAAFAMLEALLVQAVATAARIAR